MNVDLEIPTGAGPFKFHSKKPIKGVFIGNNVVGVEKGAEFGFNGIELTE